MMRFLAAIAAGLAGAVLGVVIGWLGGAVLAEAMDVSCFEGACGYFVALWALLGGAVGLIAGILVALLWKRRRPAAPPAAAQTIDTAQPPPPATDMRPGAGSTLAQLVAAIGVIAGLVIGGVWLYIWINDDTLASSNQAAPRLYYEVRFPPGTGLPENQGAVDVQLDTEKNQAWGYLPDDWRRADGDRPVVAGVFDLYYRASSRVLSIRLGDGPAYVFVLRLPRAPDHMTAYSDWYPVDYIDTGQGASPQSAGPGDDVQIRYRVVYAGYD